MAPEASPSSPRRSPSSGCSRRRPRLSSSSSRLPSRLPCVSSTKGEELLEPRPSGRCPSASSPHSSPLPASPPAERLLTSFVARPASSASRSFAAADSLPLPSASPATSRATAAPTRRASAPSPAKSGAPWPDPPSRARRWPPLLLSPRLPCVLCIASPTSSPARSHLHRPCPFWPDPAAWAPSPATGALAGDHLRRPSSLAPLLRSPEPAPRPACCCFCSSEANSSPAHPIDRSRAWPPRLGQQPPLAFSRSGPVRLCLTGPSPWVRSPSSTPSCTLSDQQDAARVIFFPCAAILALSRSS